MSRVANLYRLQTIDSQLDARRARLEAVRVALSQSAAVEQARGQLTLAESALKQARRDLQDAELAVQSQSAKISDVEARLYGGGVRNPKELQDLQRDAESLKRLRQSLEDRQLDAMGALETAEAAHALAHAALLAAVAEAEHSNAELAKEKRTLEHEIQRLEVEREAAEASLSPEDLRTYGDLRARKRGVAVSRLDDSVCSSCGVAPSSSRIQDARQGNQLIRCGNCERILFAG